MTTTPINVKGGCLSLQLQGRERLHHREHEVPEVDVGERMRKWKLVPQGRLLFEYSWRAIWHQDVGKDADEPGND